MLYRMQCKAQDKCCPYALIGGGGILLSAVLVLSQAHDCTDQQEFVGGRAESEEMKLISPGSESVTLDYCLTIRLGGRWITCSDEMET